MHTSEHFHRTTCVKTLNTRRNTRFQEMFTPAENRAHHGGRKRILLNIPPNRAEKDVRCMNQLITFETPLNTIHRSRLRHA